MTFKERFPLSGRVGKVDTLSFEDATPQEMFDYFTQRLAKYEVLVEQAEATIKANDTAQGQVVGLLKSNEDLKHELNEAKIIIKYLEREKDDRW